jgi:hypothetical protein
VPPHAAEKSTPLGLLRGGGLPLPAQLATLLELWPSCDPLTFGDGVSAAGGMSGAAAATHGHKPGNELGGEVGVTNARAR